MPGKRVGRSNARCYLVLTIRPDKGHGHHSVGSQTEPNPPQAEQEDGGPDGEQPALDESHDSRSPLIYVALLQKKSQAAEEIMRLCTLVRDHLGYLPSAMPHRLHSDRGTEFVN